MTNGEGLPKPSVANVYDVRKVLRSDLLSRWAALPPGELAHLDEGLRLVLAL